MMRVPVIVFIATLLASFPTRAAELTEAERQLAANHPRPGYEEVADIKAMADALRKELSQRERYSFSRGWWTWDRLRARYVDDGRRNRNELLILQAIFRALILDWHARLEAGGEGDLMFIYFVTTAPGSKTERKLPDGATLKRDYHGGGYHGGWGGAARMRIYEELVRQNMLTTEEKERFRRIVYQSMSSRFLDFTKGAQGANNHSYGNAGGIAMALKLFPDAPQAKEARAWIERIWKHLADYGDWTEWNYFPYGPIFLHGMIDIAEAMGWLQKESKLINAVGRRVLGFVHGGGVRGGPNCGSPVFTDRAALYADPWNVGNYRVETPGRDGHFWYRMAQHYKNREYLWAAEQSALGGQPPGKEKATPAYQQAHARRFAWFKERNLSAKVPEGKARIGLLSSLVHKIPERLYLEASREAGRPFASYFLYPHKDDHLDSLSGQLYEYAAHGAKFLHSSGKYSMLPKGGGTGEESLDVLLVLNKKHPFPAHPDRAGDGDFIRKGTIKLLPGLLKAGNNEAGDSFGQFGWTDYYGPGSKWIRRTVLTREGNLIVADEYTAGSALGRNYHAGPVWHLTPQKEQRDGEQKENWFDARAFEHAWWQEKCYRLLLTIHQDGAMRFGRLKQRSSQDLAPNVTVYGHRPVEAGQTVQFLSVFSPWEDNGFPVTGSGVITRIAEGTTTARWTNGRGRVTVEIRAEGTWNVTRTQP